MPGPTHTPPVSDYEGSPFQGAALAAVMTTLKHPALHPSEGYNPGLRQLVRDLLRMFYSSEEVTEDEKADTLALSYQGLTSTCYFGLASTRPPETVPLEDALLVLSDHRQPSPESKHRPLPELVVKLVNLPPEITAEAYQKASVKVQSLLSCFLGHLLLLSHNASINLICDTNSLAVAAVTLAGTESLLALMCSLDPGKIMTPGTFPCNIIIRDRARTIDNELYLTGCGFHHNKASTRSQSMYIELAGGAEVWMYPTPSLADIKAKKRNSYEGRLQLAESSSQTTVVAK